MTAPLDRSYLYAPTTNARILDKVLDRGSDAVVLDLEDGVAADAKDEARAALVAFLDRLNPSTSGPRILVRVNRDGDGWSELDLTAAARSGTAAISLPKAEAGAAVAEVAAKLDELEAWAGLVAGTIGLHLIIESAAGVEAIEAMARVRRVERFGLGAADLAADLGILGPPHTAALDHVRARMVIASRAAGLAAPVDAVHTDVADLDGLRSATERARGFGFCGKSAVHPSQVAVINEVFTPDADAVLWAKRIVAAADEAAADGAILLDGQLVDAPIVTRARALIQLARSRSRQDDA